MKAHIGVDVKTGLTHTFTTTPANERDLNQVHNLLHGEEKYVFVDSGYRGAQQREELKETTADWLLQNSRVRSENSKSTPELIK